MRVCDNTTILDNGVKLDGRLDFDDWFVIGFEDAAKLGNGLDGQGQKGVVGLAGLPRCRVTTFWYCGWNIAGRMTRHLRI